MASMGDFSFGDVPNVDNDDLFNMLFEDNNMSLSPDQLAKSTNFICEENIDFGFLQDDSYMMKVDMPNADGILADYPDFSNDGFLDDAVNAILPNASEPLDLDQQALDQRDYDELFGPLYDDPCSLIAVPMLGEEEEEEEDDLTIQRGERDASLVEEEVVVEEEQTEVSAVADNGAVVENPSYAYRSIDVDHGYSRLSSTTNSANSSGDEDQLVDVDDSSLPVTVASPTSSSEYACDSVTSSTASSPLGGATESMQINDILMQCTNAIQAANSISEGDIQMPREEDIYPEMNYSGKDSRLHANDHAPMQYSHFCLSQEEKEMLKKEGIVLPEDMPLTKQEDRALRLVRRKIRNKVSAKESRKRKQVYVDGLEKRIKKCTVKNMQLQRKVDILETSNVTLMSQLRKLQTIFSPKHATKPAQTRTCLMVMILSLALFAAPNMNSLSSANNGSTNESMPSQESQVNNGRSRNLLQSNSPSMEIYDELNDEIPAINKAINTMVFPSKDNSKLMELQDLMNKSSHLGNLMEEQISALRAAMQVPLDTLVNETNTTMKMASQAFDDVSSLKTDYIDEEMDDSDEDDEYNIKIEAALNNIDDTYIDPSSLNDLIAFDVTKTISTPSRKRRKVLA